MKKYDPTLIKNCFLDPKYFNTNKQWVLQWLWYDSSHDNHVKNTNLLERLTTDDIFHECLKEKRILPIIEWLPLIKNSFKKHSDDISLSPFYEFNQKIEEYHYLMNDYFHLEWGDDYVEDEDQIDIHYYEDTYIPPFQVVYEVLEYFGSKEKYLMELIFEECEPLQQSFMINGKNQIKEYLKNH